MMRDRLAINSGDMAGIMMIAIQTLEKRTAEVEAMKNENTELRKRLVALEAKMSKLISEK